MAPPKVLDAPKPAVVGLDLGNGRGLRPLREEVGTQDGDACHGGERHHEDKEGENKLLHDDFLMKNPRGDHAISRVAGRLPGTVRP